MDIQIYTFLFSFVELSSSVLLLLFFLTPVFLQSLSASVSFLWKSDEGVGAMYVEY